MHSLFEIEHREDSVEALREELDGHIGAVASRLGASSRMLAESWFARHALLGPSSTNQDTHDLPFQRWYRFKEAFAPRAVVEAFSKLNCVPATCIDPFGGSGTTALTGQFLGVRPTTIEVNPFLADLIEAKLASYEPDELISSYRAVVDAAAARQVDMAQAMAEAPPTFIEPGVNGRWIFSAAVAERILAHRMAIDDLADTKHARMLRVLLGSTLITLSNVVISGKGRRYRRGWERRTVTPATVARLFEIAFLNAIEDVVRFGRRSCTDYTLLRGDARTALAEVEGADFSLFSPPYPNSFDYTDIYNVELWMLGYLRNSAENRTLRQSTLRSHVQIKRSYDATIRSPLLDDTLERLNAHRAELWDRDIPDMVCAYFEDLNAILAELQRIITPGGSVMMVVGDSRYAGVSIDVGAITVEIAAKLGFDLKELSQMRSMRSSAQQGGGYDLGETLVHLIRS